MKKAILILVMTLIAATSYNQTSRRSSNSNSTAERSKNTRTTTTNRNTSTRSTSVNKSTTNRSRSSQPTTVTRTTSTRTTTTTNPRTRNVHHTGKSGREVTVNRTVTHTNSNKPSHATRTVHVTYPSSRSYRGNHHTTYVYHNAPRSRSYREKHYTYRRPVHVDVYWTRDMHRRYVEMYPTVHTWNYHHGYRINTISAYRADRYIGDVMSVYGKITEVFYSRETDEYFLYIGPYYPYQDFTVVVPGRIARKYSRRPGYYFDNQHINVTGLITSFEGQPEIVVKRDFQLDVY